MNASPCPEEDKHTPSTLIWPGNHWIDGEPAGKHHTQKECPTCRLWVIWERKPTCPQCGREVVNPRRRHLASLPGGPVCSRWLQSGEGNSA